LKEVLCLAVNYFGFEDDVQIFVLPAKRQALFKFSEKIIGCNELACRFGMAANILQKLKL
jgi:hypothetical protein